MKISLIVTSRDGIENIRRLFSSILYQKEILLENIEIIFADQGSMYSEISLFSSRLNIIYKKIEPSSLSSARNQVISDSQGNIIGFPDDDCWFHELFFRDLIQYFTKNPSTPMLVCNIYDPTTNHYYGKRPKINTALNSNNIYHFPSSINMFINLNIVNKSNIYFNEKLGVGTKWGAGEDVELAFRINSKYYKSHYDGLMNVYHPANRAVETPNKAYYYGLGTGALAAHLLIKGNFKHISRYMKYIIRSALGMVYYLIKFDRMSLQSYSFRFFGLVFGFFDATFFLFKDKLK